MTAAPSPSAATSSPTCCSTWAWPPPGERVFTGAGEIRAVLSDWPARVNGWRRVA